MFRRNVFFKYKGREIILFLLRVLSHIKTHVMSMSAFISDRPHLNILFFSSYAFYFGICTILLNHSFLFLKIDIIILLFELLINN